MGLVGGLVGAGVVVGILAYRKQRELSARAVSLRDAVAQQGQALEAYLLSKGAGIEPELAAMSDAAAQRAAEYHLATSYGITPDFVALVQRAAARIGSA